MHAYIGWRIIAPSRLKYFQKWTAWLVLFVMSLFLPLTFKCRLMGIHAWWCDLSGWIGYTSLGFLSVVFAFLLLSDCLWIVAAFIRLTGRLTKKFTSTQPATKKAFNRERRYFLIQSVNLGILGGSAVLTGFGFYEARRNPALVKVSVPISELPKDLEGLKIAQISDLHVGLTIKRAFLERVVRQVNDLKAPVIALTGDLVDGPVAGLLDELAPLQDLHAPCGKFFVTGNHEYYSGVGPWIDQIERLGFTVLLNDHRIVTRGTSNIVLAGVTDYSGGRFLKSHISNPKRALDGAEKEKVKILLAHQPRSIFSAARAGFDLQLSGHTHGGQYIPWNTLVGLYQPFLKGLHRYEKTWIYVNSGTGYWGPPMRFGVPSEITLINLTRRGDTKQA